MATITPGGLFEAFTPPTTPVTVVVTATSATNPNLTGTATVTISDISGDSEFRNQSALLQVVVRNVIQETLHAPAGFTTFQETLTSEPACGPVPVAEVAAAQNTMLGPGPMAQSSGSVNARGGVPPDQFGCSAGGTSEVSFQLQAPGSFALQLTVTLNVSGSGTGSIIFTGFGNSLIVNSSNPMIVINQAEVVGNPNLFFRIFATCFSPDPDHPCSASFSLTLTLTAM